jgi:hypothetical protein
VENYSPEDWQYVMDMPSLYSLVRPDGQGCRVLLEEESNSSKDVYASATQARWALCFNTKSPGFFDANKVAKHEHPFAAIGDYSKWKSTGLKKSFRD